MAPAAYGGDLLPDVRGNVAGRSASCTAVATGDRAFKLAQLELLNGNNNNHVGLPSMPLDTPGPGSWKPSSMLHLVEEGDGEDYDDGKGGKKKGVMKSVSSFFKNLVKSNSKPDSDSVLTVGSSAGSMRDSPVTHVSPVLSPQASAHSSSALSPHLLASTGSDDNGGRRQSSSRPGTGPGGAGGKKGDVATTPQGSRLSFTSMFNRKSSKTLSALANAPPSPKCKLLARSPVAPPKMNRPEWRMKDYAIVEKVYTGYASTVYKAFCKLSGVMVCLKAYNLANLCELNRYQIFREIRLHSSLQHEHIITLYGAFQEGSEVVLVQEYADGGDLFNLLHKYGGRMSERTCVELVLWPFLNVLLFLHAEHIVHRDIKPENVLFTSDKRLKLCDFGLAIDLREERAVTRAGTLEYMAPEVLNCPFKSRPDENKEKESIHYSNAVDAWAMGVLTYELLVGMPPFHDKQRNAIEDKIRVSEPRFPSKMSDAARNFITEALAKDAIERPTIRDMMSHPFVHMHRSNRSMRNLAAPRKPVPAPDEEETDLRNELQQMATPKYQSFTAGKLHKPAVMMVPKRAGLEAGNQGPGSVLPSIAADPGMSPKAQNQARFKQWAGAMPLPPTSGLVEVGRTHSVL